MKIELFGRAHQWWVLHGNKDAEAVIVLLPHNTVEHSSERGVTGEIVAGEYQRSRAPHCGKRTGPPTVDHQYSDREWTV
jgi:hypothetical protein